MSLIKTPVLKNLAQQVEAQNTAYRWLDLYAAEFVVKGLLEEERQHASSLALLICELSYATSKGQICIALSAHKIGLDHDFKASLLQLSVVDDFSQARAHKRLHAKQSVKPLVVSGDKLYLTRYWNLQCEFEAWLAKRVSSESLSDEALSESQLDRLSQCLKSMFALNGVDSDEKPDWQAVAAAHALLQKTTLIAGGPGTGKTTTAASLLHLVDQSFRLRLGRPAKVRLLAPTGKAAIRLADSIAFQLKRIETEQAVLEGSDMLPLSACLPANGETIHRFLIDHKALPSQHSYSEKLNAESLFSGRSEIALTEADILIVDESSMIDLALMHALIKTVPDTTQVIFMGDPYQLPPVEPGEVFSETVRRFEDMSYSSEFADRLASLTGYESGVFLTPAVDKKVASEGINQALCYLRKTYRFGGELKRAAEQINAGNFIGFRNDFCISRHLDSNNKQVRWFDYQEGENQAEMNTQQVHHSITAAYQSYFEAVQKQADIAALNSAFADFQLLCSTHEGEQGVIAMNNYIERSLLAMLPGHYSANVDTGSFLYHGKAILITKNHADLGVFNGDIGFVVARNDEPGSTGKFQVEVPQGSGESIIVSPKRLKAWQPAYAMTVHKSQGSEYQRVGILLADYAKELLSRSLLYTGLTRAKQRCDIWADTQALEKAFLE